MTRLYALGYRGHDVLGMRPWTRRSVLHMLQASKSDILVDENQRPGHSGRHAPYLSQSRRMAVPPRGLVYGFETRLYAVYGIGGPTLRDSYHLGQTISNDYGRPYQTGFNSDRWVLDREE